MAVAVGWMVFVAVGSWIAVDTGRVGELSGAPWVMVDSTSGTGSQDVIQKAHNRMNKYL